MVYVSNSTWFGHVRLWHGNQVFVPSYCVTSRFYVWEQGEAFLPWHCVYGICRVSGHSWGRILTSGLLHVRTQD